VPVLHSISDKLSAATHAADGGDIVTNTNSETPELAHKHYVYVGCIQRVSARCVSGIPCSGGVLIYLLTAIGLSPGGSTHLHTNNNRITQITTNVEECGPCPEFYTGIYLTTEEKARNEEKARLRKKHGRHIYKNE
jgi:hypothetical protein